MIKATFKDKPTPPLLTWAEVPVGYAARSTGNHNHTYIKLSSAGAVVFADGETKFSTISVMGVESNFYLVGLDITIARP